jgi:putative transposase
METPGFSPESFIYFKKLIICAQKKFEIETYHYCFMNNHVHMLVRAVRSSDMPKFFQNVLQRYAHYFRKKYGRTGFLFQNRYKCLHIDSDKYLMECGRYIERNPVRAGITEDPVNYAWSSYLFYATGKNDDIIEKPNPVYADMAYSSDERMRRYREYVMQGRLYEHVVDQAFRIV